MGKHFGELGFIRGIIYYKLSPHEQKPFAKAITYGIPNILSRTLMSVVYWLPPFVIGYLTYAGVEDRYRRSKRKDPKDYVDEQDPNEGISTASATDQGSTESQGIPVESKKKICEPKKPKQEG